MNFLHLLLNKQIENIYSDVGEFIDLDGENHQSVPEIVIHIEDCSLCISNPIQLGPGLQALEDLLGQRILEVEDDDAHIKITFEEGLWIEIDMRAEAYIGPEALVLWGPDNLCVVWNGN